MNLGDIAVDAFKEGTEMTWVGFWDFLLNNKKITPMIKEVKKQKVSGVIYVPKKYIGKRVMVIINGD